MAKDTKLTIELQGLRFYGQYGLYPVEAQWTTELILDVSIQMQLEVNQSIQLNDTVDYVDLYAIIKSHMNRKHELLEAAAYELIEKIKKSDKRIVNCKVRILKKPQIGGRLDDVAVQLEY